MPNNLITQQTWWQNYLDHVLMYEGKTSKDTRDPAYKCAPTKGGIHTNMGVTYCTFKSLAAYCHVTPVTYDRFLKMTKQDISNFLYYGFYDYLNLKYFKPSIALSLLEIAWGAGPDDAAKALSRALAKLGHPVPPSSHITMEMINQATKVGVNQLFSAIWNSYLDFLKSQTKKWAIYGKGYQARIDSFVQKFHP